MAALVASPDAQGLAPAAHRVGPHAPPVSNGNSRLALDGLRQIAVDDEAAPAAAPLAPHRPRNPPVANADDPHVATHGTLNHRSVAEARRAVGTKPERVASRGAHEMAAWSITCLAAPQASD